MCMFWGGCVRVGERFGVDGRGFGVGVSVG